MGSFLRKKLANELPYGPATRPLVQKHKAEKPVLVLGITMFMAARVTIDRIWTQPKCLRTDEWLRKLRYIYTREYRPALRKKNKTEEFSGPPKEGCGEYYADQ